MHESNITFEKRVNELKISIDEKTNNLGNLLCEYALDSTFDLFSNRKKSEFLMRIFHNSKKTKTNLAIRKEIHLILIHFNRLFEKLMINAEYAVTITLFRRICEELSNFHENKAACWVREMTEKITGIHLNFLIFSILDANYSIASERRDI